LEKNNCTKTSEKGIVEFYRIDLVQAQKIGRRKTTSERCGMKKKSTLLEEGPRVRCSTVRGRGWKITSKGGEKRDRFGPRATKVNWLLEP